MLSHKGWSTNYGGWAGGEAITGALIGKRGTNGGAFGVRRGDMGVEICKSKILREGHVLCKRNHLEVSCHQKK